MTGLLACAPGPGSAPDAPPEASPGTPQLSHLVLLNEVMADNESTVNGPDGESLPDWVELVNASDEPIAWDRIRIESEDGAWHGSGTRTLEPGGRVLIWFDDTMEPGEIWTGFGLGKTEDFVVVHVDGQPSDMVELRDVGEDVSIARSPDTTGELVATAWPTPGEANLDEPSPMLDTGDATLFVPHVMHSIRFDLSAEALQAIDGADRPMVHASAVIDGVRYGDIGLGLKGSASYDKMYGKPAFKVVLNEWVPGLRFRGQRALSLNNGSAYDPTRTREYLAYGLAREAGLMAPRVGWAEVWANDEYLGLYMVVERYEEEFIEYRRPGHGETGFVFEGNRAESGLGDYDFGEWPDVPDFDQEEGPRPPPVDVRQSIERVDAIIKETHGHPTDAGLAELWTHVNKDQFLTYLAWEAMVSHWDGYRIPNNWRFYVDPVSYEIEWVPSGADWTWNGQPSAYGSNGSVAQYCVRSPACRRELSFELLEMADRAERMNLIASFQDLSTWLDPYIEKDPRYEDSSGVDEARGLTLQCVTQNPQIVRDTVYRAFPDLSP